MLMHNAGENSLGRARELCPDIQTIPYDYPSYQRISYDFYRILLSHADILQPISVDEAYIDVSSQVPSVAQDPATATTAALALATTIRDEIRQATQCEASIGISHNMVLARMATDKAKPASAYHLLPTNVAAFLAPLKVDRLPGVGYSMAEKLAEQMGIETLADVISAGPSRLRDTLGDGQGVKVFEFASGIDRRALEPPGPRKSVSVELNYAIRFQADAEASVRSSPFFYHIDDDELIHGARTEIP